MVVVKVGKIESTVAIIALVQDQNISDVMENPFIPDAFDICTKTQ